MLVAGLLLQLTLASGTSPAEPAVVRASLEQDLVCFDTPVGFDWEGTARREFKAFPIESPPKELVHQGDRGHVEFDYTAPLPESLSGIYFYLVGERGVVRLKPGRLYGFIRYRRDTVRASPTFWGRICSVRQQDVADAGFVIASHHKISWNWHIPETIAYENNVLVRLDVGASRLPTSGVDSHPSTPKTMLVVSGSGVATRYLFIRRVPDKKCIGACCEFAYDLYKWEPGLPQVLWSAYGCDI